MNEWANIYSSVILLEWTLEYFKNNLPALIRIIISIKHQHYSSNQGKEEKRIYREISEDFKYGYNQDFNSFSLCVPLPSYSLPPSKTPSFVLALFLK